MLLLLTTGLTLAGLALLVTGTYYTQGIIRELPDSACRYSWRVLLGLILAFIPGYLAFAVHIQGQAFNPMILLVAVVFLGGGGFVFTVTRLSATTLREVKQVTTLQHENDRIRSMQRRLQTILDNAAEGIITFDSAGMILSFNAAAEKLFGYSEQEVVKQDLCLVIPPPAHEQRQGYLCHFMRNQIQQFLGHEGEIIGRHKDGSRFPMALKVSRITLEGEQVYTGLVANISERKAMLDHLKHMAQHDGLTGLYNRSYMQDQLERVVERAIRTGGICCAVLYIDLDNFKYINDTMGHAAGDKLLIDVANILKRRVRKSEMIARFGGDEFIVILFDTTPIIAMEVADAFRKQLVDYTFRHQGQEVDIGCSIGVSPIGPEPKTAEEVLSQADFACNLAKRQGRNRVRLFRPEDQSNVTTLSLDMGWSRRIKEALEHNRFALTCQPIVATADRRVDAYEILLRMLDEHGELIMPSGFLPAAERFGLAADIDRWVVMHAIDTLIEQRQRFPGLRYSINLSGQTLGDTLLCEDIQDKLQDTGLDPGALTFEVTETVAIADITNAQTFLGKLQALGCKTALDDFGSGMSSFAYLKDLPVDIVKIDGRFVRNLVANRVDQAMVRAMNEIAHALGKQTVAEFVEHEDCMRLLTEYGVDYGQGYHLGRPNAIMPWHTSSQQAGASSAYVVPISSAAQKTQK